MSETGDGASVRQRLYDVFEGSDRGFVEKCRAVLALGRDYLDVENGNVQRFCDDGGTNEVLVSVGSTGDTFATGATLDRSTTYCRRTVEQRTPLALADASTAGWTDDPAYEEHAFDCYLGATVFRHGEPFGTVCFVSRDPRPEPFDSEEQAFVEVLARQLGRELEQTAYDQRLADSEQARRESVDKYQALVELAPDAVVLVDADDGTIREANQATGDLTGYTQSTLEGLCVHELYPESDRERYRRLFSGGRTLARSRFDDGRQLYVRQADGTDVPVEMSARTVELDDRELVLGILRDISDRRAREQDLERSRDFMRQTQTIADLGGWEFDCETGALRWDDEVYRIHGVGQEYEPTVEAALEFYHPEDRPALKDAFERLATEGEPYDLELRFRTADGDSRWARTIGVPRYDDGGDEVVAVHGVMQDITERRERETDRRVKTRAIDEASVGITIADASKDDLPLIYANDEFERLTGYSTEKALGSNCRFLQGPETDEERVAAIREAIAAERPVTTELLNYRADGTPFWNELTVTPVTTTDGETVTHFVGFQRDITPRKRHERVIDVLNRVLRHNLRNDMTVIAGNAEEIAARDDGAVGELAERILDSATGLTALAEKASTLQSVMQEPEPPEQRSIPADVTAAVADVRGAYPDRTVRVDAPEECTAVATKRLRIALREVLTNAVEHGGSGPVRVAVEPDTDRSVAVRVRDSGGDLTEPEIEALQTGVESPLCHGSGLGLWVVNWLVTSMGGHVTAEADDHTTVSLVLRTAPADGDGRGIPQRRAISTRSEDGPR